MTFRLRSALQRAQAVHRGPSGVRWTPLPTLAILVAAVTACARGPRPILDLEDLARELRAAGAELAPTELLAYSGFDSPGTVLQVNQALVQVYQFESVEARQRVSDQIAPDGLSVGGRPLTWGGHPNLWAAGRLIVVYEGSDGGTILLLSGLLGDPLTGPASEVGEPYPPAVSAAVEILARQLGLDPAAVAVVDFEEVEWADACLELPEPGEVCAEVITPGWRVQLRADDDDYLAHTDIAGERVRLSADGERP
ncbi:MAG: hypothetical protein AB1449_06420 [Chloroflexota bacterium]